MNATTSEITTNGLRYIGALVDDIHEFQYASRSRGGLVHELSVDASTKQGVCSCEDYSENRAPSIPRLDDANLCDHLIVAIAYLKEHRIMCLGRVPVKVKVTQAAKNRRCNLCNQTGAKHEVVNDSGYGVRGYICETCKNNPEPAAAYYPEPDHNYEPEHVPTWDEGMQAYP